MVLSDKLQYSEGKCSVCKRNKKDVVVMDSLNRKHIEYLKIKIVKNHKLKQVCKCCLSKDAIKIREIVNKNHQDK